MLLLMPLLFARGSLCERVGKKSLSRLGALQYVHPQPDWGTQRGRDSLLAHSMSVYANQGVRPTGTSAARSQTGSLYLGCGACLSFLTDAATEVVNREELVVEATCENRCPHLKEKERRSADNLQCIKHDPGASYI